jgi:hypothetical protein
MIAEAMSKGSRHRPQQSSIAGFCSYTELRIHQRFEGLEAFGVETANRYEVCAPDGRPVLRVREREGGFWQGVARQVAGHEWLSAFTVDVVDLQGNVVLVLEHPSEWGAHRLRVRSGSGRYLGCAYMAFSWFDKRLDVLDASDGLLLRLDAGMWSNNMRLMFAPPERARLVPNGCAAVLQKQWGGLLTEMFTDRDSFALHFANVLSAEERALAFATALFADLVFYERKAGE